jgi:hypothetical protein
MVRYPRASQSLAAYVLAGTVFGAGAGTIVALELPLVERAAR